MPLLSTFLTIKTGPTATEKEKAVYHGMTVSGLVDRLLRKRPLMFMTSADQFLLTNGMDGAGAEKFDLIGSEEEAAPHLLNDLQSYDEMALSSMLGVSVPTHFINSGDRGNQAVPTELEVVGGELVGERHERRGIYIAQVGARFERAGRMEYRWMVVQDTQNTTSAGYGREGDPLLLVCTSSLSGNRNQCLTDTVNRPGPNFMVFPTFQHMMRSRRRQLGATRSQSMASVTLFSREAGEAQNTST